MKKILVFLLILLIAFMPVISFASDYEVPEGALNYNYYVGAYHDTLNWYGVFCFNNINDLKVITQEGSGGTKTGLKYISSGIGKIYEKDLDTGIWRDSRNNDLGTWFFSSLAGANTDIYNWDEETVFFSPPEMPKLLKLMETVDLWMILRTISHGLILVIGCLILAICFRKAWGFLQSQLRN